MGGGTVNAPTASATPVEVKNLDGIKALSAGFDTACAIAADDSLWCWGSNEGGKLGDGKAWTSTPGKVLLPNQHYCVIEGIGDSRSPDMRPPKSL